MANVTIISDHIARAEARLLEQYKQSERIRGIISDITIQVQQIEDMLFDVLDGRTIDTAIGQQLDNLGKILGLNRVPGQSDEEYRTLLKAQIIVNVSNGEPSQVINFFKILTNAMQIYLGDLAFGEVSVMSELVLTQDDVDLYFKQIKRVLGAGIRVESLGTFDIAEPFAFAGTYAIGRGFGDSTDLTAGGKLATISRNTDEKFAFDGVIPTQGGFGSTADPITGGVLIAL